MKINRKMQGMSAKEVQNNVLLNVLLQIAWDIWKSENAIMSTVMEHKVQNINGRDPAINQRSVLSNHNSASFKSRERIALIAGVHLYSRAFERSTASSKTRPLHPSVRSRRKITLLSLCLVGVFVSWGQKLF
ncbi:hypothetical protein ILYODFUR_000538 [Ilyodon furcidens]|uniref:Uncharacterized protein n=1 Tax=Ilyodon furcidens TaxID=33524 RepID=A0ABV0SKK6_9TELE